jgi:PAS domain S-box-containing protein
MSEIVNPEKKKQVVKEIIKNLHQGMSVDEAKKILVKETGSITSLEIAEIEQSLINEGISPDEIKKFCNVHALLFESTLKQQLKEENPAHPVSLFRAENCEIEKLLEEIKKCKEKTTLKSLLEKLRAIDIHYTRKEQLLFPYLEKAGFFGPSKVMWGKDNDIRKMLKDAIAKIDEIELAPFVQQYLNPLLEEISGMIFKEENILFPTALEKLTADDWVAILKESSEIGYAFIRPPDDTEKLIAELKKSLLEETKFENGKINFPSGNLTLEELLSVFNTLPVDITFINKEDKVSYFSEGKNRIFLRPRSVIGRDVRNCHPPQSVDKVEKILSDFKEGKKDAVDFWINFKGRFVYIRYFAVRDSLGKYLGTLEVTQDITDIKKLEGEKRLA